MSGPSTHFEGCKTGCPSRTTGATKVDGGQISQRGGGTKKCTKNLRDGSSYPPSNHLSARRLWEGFRLMRRQLASILTKAPIHVELEGAEEASSIRICQPRKSWEGDGIEWIWWQACSSPMCWKGLTGDFKSPSPPWASAWIFPHWDWVRCLLNISMVLSNLVIHPTHSPPLVVVP